MLQTFLHWELGKQYCSEGGGQTFYVGGSGGYDHVDEEMDMSEATFL